MNYSMETQSRKFRRSVVVVRIQLASCGWRRITTPIHSTDIYRICNDNYLCGNYGVIMNAETFTVRIKFTSTMKTE